MPGKSVEKIELRTAQDGEDGMFYFLGYSSRLPDSVITKSTKSSQHYHPFYAQHNKDGSTMLQFYRADFTDMTVKRELGKARRLDNYYDFIAENVVPQLMEESGCGVDWNREIAVVKLPPGRLSLFVPELKSVFTAKAEDATVTNTIK